MGKKWIRLLSMALCLTIPLGYAALGGGYGSAGWVMARRRWRYGGRRPAARGQRTNQCSHCDYGRGGGIQRRNMSRGPMPVRSRQETGCLPLTGWSISSGDYTFNGLVVSGSDSVVRLQKSSIVLGVDTEATDDDTGGAAVNLDNGATLYISDSDLTVDGAARYVTANYNDATLIVNHATVTSTGSNEYTAAFRSHFPMRHC